MRVIVDSVSVGEQGLLKMPRSVSLQWEVISLVNIPNNLKLICDMSEHYNSSSERDGICEPRSDWVQYWEHVCGPKFSCRGKSEKYLANFYYK